MRSNNYGHKKKIQRKIPRSEKRKKSLSITERNVQQEKLESGGLLVTGDWKGLKYNTTLQ